MQKRLKKAGTWWLKENAEAIAELRTLRANGGWDLL
jgi:post-segregation antitoxin (ccd killing protein)